MRAGLRFLVLTSVALACGRATEMRVEPANGESDGGQTVRLVGSDFLGHGPAVVYLGMRSARAVVLEDDHHISLKTPEAEGFGAVDVRVEFADGTSHTLPQAFTYRQVEGKPLRPVLFKPGTAPVPTAK
ncbi:IPT/TIG domain-containing protein [Nannocystis bainbridge]|uniref:IPT/TIG domain-containing protein n=1 Tax=Nannocystis bainbridge TaxID=2995303 RepID=A0ABT5E2H4_9BACT|nr:IPT/TIG domain-containing protein [Nannocystis bainbridge]MDC0719623.1 IPT/TIG domain-containing protein [Nannocystis bainbridge]